MFSYADVVSFRNQENILRASNVTTSTKTEKKSRKKKKKKKVIKDILPWFHIHEISTYTSFSLTV